MLKQKDDAVDGLTKGVEFLMKKNKVDYVKGFGRIAGKGRVEVTGPDGAKQTLETKNIVIATGSEPTPLPNIDIDEERIVSSTGALSLKQVPKKLIVVGAGVIGLELGSASGAALARKSPSSNSSIRSRLRSTPKSRQAFQKILKKQGVKFELGHKVTGIEKLRDGLQVSIEPAKGGGARTLDADVVLVAIGRRPFTKDLGLETVGIKTDQRGFIPHDGHLKAADGVYVIGDVTTGPCSRTRPKRRASPSPKSSPANGAM
jgi:dihydrolipoamide dehydrogenase